MEDLRSRLKNQYNGKGLSPHLVRILDNELRKGCSLRVLYKRGLVSGKIPWVSTFQKSNRPTPVVVLKSRGTKVVVCTFFFYSLYLFLLYLLLKTGQIVTRVS